MKNVLNRQDSKTVEEKKSFFRRSSSIFSNQSSFQDERSSDEEIELEAANGKTVNLADIVTTETLTLGYSIEEGLGPLKQLNKNPRFCCSCPSSSKRRRRWFYALVIALLFVILLSLTIAVTTNKKQQKSTSASFVSPDDGEVDGTTTTTSVGGASSEENGGGGGGGEEQGTYQSDSSSSGNQPSAPAETEEKKYDGPYYQQSMKPLSLLDPVNDLNLYAYERPTTSIPSSILEPLNRKAMPTNAWYQNLLRFNADEDPSMFHRVYTIPYLLDVAGSIPGIRMHNTRLVAAATQVTVTIDEPFAVTLGAMSNIATGGSIDSSVSKSYTVRQATELGITLQWDTYDMKSNIVRGSPYVTMIYNTGDTATSDILPTIYSGIDMSELPIVDGNTQIDCTMTGETFNVQDDIELAFSSGQRWLFFFSRPVDLQCQSVQGSFAILQVVNNDTPLIIRAALIMKSANTADDEQVFASSYAEALRSSQDLFPGELTNVVHSFDIENGSANHAQITFDWDPQSMHINGGGIGDTATAAKSGAGEMIMFALPHHQDLLGSDVVMTDLCTTSLVGSVCLVKGNVWNMEEILPDVDFQASRHPDPKYLPVIAEALLEDIKYQIPDNFQIGAGDTYFSGKVVARLARILLITEELKEICAGSDSEYTSACNGLQLPSDEEFNDALNQLRRAVTVWVKENEHAPFVYDTAWGGIVSCGCLYKDGLCTNQFPDCPAFTDQGLNFGNGFYNDHHFHYGYHVYASAVLAHFDEAWAVENYENVLLLVRDYANPSRQDLAFPTFRHKDFYNGHSWASGITNPMFPNIMNQESSSEAIAGYEAVSLYGKVMTSIFQKSGDTERAATAELMHNVGLTLTATEIRSTQKYWHVLQDVADSEKTYPSEYEHRVVGIFWSTFIQFGTWFGNSPYLIYGIQLLPLTPISESRDDLAWAKEIYAPLAASCDRGCVSEGWSIQLFAILATIGHAQAAVDLTLKLSPSVYEGPGGNGHSKSNTLWYIATRPAINDPYPEENLQLIEVPELTCSQPSTCTREYLSEMAGEYSCRARIEWLMNVEDMSENMACAKIAGVEYQTECGLCFPDGATVDLEDEAEDTGNDTSSNSSTEISQPDDSSQLTCLQPTRCTDEVLDTLAGDHTCRERISYLMTAYKQSEESACRQIAEVEWVVQCGQCRPTN